MMNLGVAEKLQYFSEGFLEFINDVQAKEISKHNLDKYVDGHILVENDVKDMLIKVLSPNVEQINEGSDHVSSDDDITSIKFDDSEKKELVKEMKDL